MKRLISFLLLALTLLGSSAQTISGTLIDEKSIPISFADVAIIKTQAGTFTDDGGRFAIDVSGLAQTDEIQFSHLGYVDIKMTVAALSAQKGPITMQAKNYSLQEVVVGPGNARDVLMDALAHIKDNYPGEFTKNHIIFKNYNVINNEPINYDYYDFDMYLPSYLAKDSPRIYSVDHKHEVYEKKKTLFKGQADPIFLMKFMYPERLFNKRTMDEGNFQLSTTPAIIDGEEYDVVEFNRTPQKSDPSIATKGRIYFKGHAYINKKDKGIKYIDLHVYNERSARFMLVVKMDTLNINAKVSYKKVDGKYVLDYLSQNSNGSGSFFGKHLVGYSSSSARVIDRQLHLKMNEIVMKTEVDDIVLKEKPKDISEMKNPPDMK